MEDKQVGPIVPNPSGFGEGWWWMSFLDFLRSEPVRVGMKAGFLGAVIYVALRYLLER